ncbi:E3 ubiquitin- ligase ATL4 [Olea europaea subsp. europaea]|uniref:E3 ubiquitin- ligase ATL4 n=1 Tax=Olea europaea subsp. europaea TaxID=158383 RepID=A0A8S0US75_OLEEU|nr:E3 ubiquitin- ligase ATL4 [Olea europaea subsp. europaea]
MSTFPMPPPPPPLPTLAFINGGSATPTNQIPPYMNTSSPSPSSSSSIVIVIIIVASAIIVSASIYLLLRLISKRFHRSFRTFAAAEDVVLRHHSNPNLNRCHMVSSNLLDSLPLFTFGSITGNLTGGDCAVCLSKFEPHDQLCLLPLCCHAFHAGCIDTWLVSNQTCPLCRSSVLPSDSEVLDKIQMVETGGGNNIDNNFENRNGSENGGSFRIEMGSISRRRGTEDTGGGGRRSYSIGSFEYIVDNGYEVSVGSTNHRRGSSDCTSIDKESSIGVPVAEPLPVEVLAGEVSRGRNWLRDYVDRLASVSVSSRSLSFRSSGRFFTGSSRRSDTVVPVEDLEANRVGDEISELFRWLSGV